MKKKEENKERGIRCNHKAFIIDGNTMIHSISFNIEYDKTGRNSNENELFPRLVIKGFDSSFETKTVINPNSRNWWNANNRSFYSTILDFEDNNNIFGKYNKLDYDQFKNEFKTIINSIYNGLKDLENKRFYIESVTVKYRKPIEDLYLSEDEKYEHFSDKYDDILNDNNGCDSMLHFIENNVYISIECKNTIYDGIQYTTENVDNFMKTFFDIKIKKGTRNEKTT